VRQDAHTQLAPQLAALIEATGQVILQPIFDLESPAIATARLALVGDAAFVARPHVATGVMKAAVDAESLVAAIASTGPLAEGLCRYNDTRQPYGAALVARGRHIGSTFMERGGDPSLRRERLMREYGAAGLVRGAPIEAHLPG
jgi:2-polyprenyl-6-methoxyphenol hydroxylase-like FAD-dependent oxidoreductase